MDLQSVLDEVDTWPTEERIQLMQGIWDRLVKGGYDPELTDELRETLKSRLADFDANPTNVLTWEEIEEYVRRPR